VSYWKDLSAERIEHEYNPRHAVPNFMRHIEWREEASRKFRACQGPPQSLRYGDGVQQMIDYFALPECRGTLCFIHGGAWRSGDRANFHYMVPAMRQLGLASCFIGYPLAPKARLSEMVDSVAAGFSMLASETIAPILLCGHSAGAQLAATILQHHALKARIAGALLISGLFDLAAVARTTIDDDLKLTETEISMFTPFGAGGWRIPTTIAVGELETGGFKDEASRIYELAPEHHRSMEIIAGENHFSIVRQLDNVASPLLRRSACLFADL
jgi:arylformamidase